MKKVFIASILAFGLLSANTASVSAKTVVEVSAQPDWGPSGYNNAGFYYLPEAGVYYDVANAVFIYLEGNKWMKRKALPPRFGKIDLYRTYKAVITGDSAPWRKNKTYKQRFNKYAKTYDKQTPVKPKGDNRGGDNRNDNRNTPNNNRQGQPQGQNGRDNNVQPAQNKQHNAQQGNDKNARQQNNNNRPENQNDREHR